MKQTILDKVKEGIEAELKEKMFTNYEKIVDEVVAKYVLALSEVMSVETFGNKIIIEIHKLKE